MEGFPSDAMGEAVPHLSGDSVRIRPLVAVAALTATLAASLVAVAPSVGAASTNPPRRIVTGWLPYWTASSSTAVLVANKDLFSDASPFWFTASSATVITPHLDATTRATQTTQIHAAGVPVLPTVTDGLPTHGMAAVLANATTRGQHVAALVSTVVANGYDGIDLDYEKFAFSDGSSTWAATRPAWVAFVGQLAAALHAQGKKLAITVPYMDSPTTGYWVYDYAGIGAAVDRLRIMTYDYSVSAAGPIAPISWVDRVAAFAVTQVPASKVQIGVPTYGRDWPASTTGCPVDNLPVRTSLTAQDAAALATSLSVAPAWNATYGERTFSYRKAYAGHSATGAAATCTITRTVWYDDRSSALLRAQLVGKYRLGGVAFWTIGGEDPGQWSLLRSYARSIAPDPTTTALSLSATSVTYGSPVVLHGMVRRPDRTGIGGVHVYVQARRVGSTTWQNIVSTLTAADGSIRAEHVPAAPTQYRILTMASWLNYASYSGTGQVGVARHVTLASSVASLPAPARFTLSGSVQPKGAGVRVYLQRWTGTAYVLLTSTLAGASGGYAFTIVPGTAGSWGFRTFVYGDATYGAYTTARVTVPIG